MRSYLMFVIFCFINCLAWAQSAAQDKIRSNLATNQVSGDAVLTTHFVERGLSMSNNTPALNASFLYNLGSQVRMGFWGGNISNITAADDSFWLKILAEFNVEFSGGLNSEFYISDNHFYKSGQRNGQRIGANFTYYSYFYGLEWMSNIEGTKNNGEYIYFGKMFGYGNRIKYGGQVGYTLSHHAALNSYFDLKAVGQYVINSDTYLEAAATLISNNSYFGKRGDPTIAASMKLSY